MLILLSPAKKLLTDLKSYTGATTTPSFLDKTLVLAHLMKEKTINEIVALMDLSQSLAELNYTRYQHFNFKDEKSPNSYPALFLFQGDVYQGLNAASWDKKTVDFSQNHLRILSGLYGLLKPLDTIQPYRLEMGVGLKNPEGKNLYDFWKDTVTDALNKQLAAQENPILINLASSEYFNAVDETRLKFPICTINFYERKNDKMKIIGIHAKKARGTMAKFLMQNQFDEIGQIKNFNELGYQYHESTSDDTHLNFVRDSQK